jgi:hypothetical protein
MMIHWTYSNRTLTPNKVRAHEKAKIQYESDRAHFGGLGRSPIFTHCICAQGRLFTLEYCPGNDIHVAIIGGVNEDGRFENTATPEQLLTLANLVRFYRSLGEPVLGGNLKQFDFETWLKAINM